jgi:hypothetical protein
VTGGTLLIHVDFPVNGIEGAVEIETGGATFDNVTVDNNNIQFKIEETVLIAQSGQPFKRHLST